MIFFFEIQRMKCEWKNSYFGNIFIGMKQKMACDNQCFFYGKKSLQSVLFEYNLRFAIFSREISVLETSSDT